MTRKVTESTAIKTVVGVFVTVSEYLLAKLTPAVVSMKTFNTTSFLIDFYTTISYISSYINYESIPLICLKMERYNMYVLKWDNTICMRCSDETLAN